MFLGTFAWSFVFVSLPFYIETIAHRVESARNPAAYAAAAVRTFAASAPGA